MLGPCLEARSDDPRLQGIFAAILNGQAERGTGGVAYVVGDDVAYQYVSELPNGTFRGALTEVMDADQNEHFFVVEEKDHQLVVKRYPKQFVHDSLVARYGGTVAGADAGASPCVVEEAGPSGADDPTDPGA